MSHNFIKCGKCGDVKWGGDSMPGRILPDCEKCRTGFQATAKEQLLKPEPCGEKSDTWFETDEELSARLSREMPVVKPTILLTEGDVFDRVVLRDAVKEIFERRDLDPCWFCGDDGGDCANWDTCLPDCPLKILATMVGLPVLKGDDEDEN